MILNKTAKPSEEPEFEGQSIEEAIQKAEKSFGTEREQLQIKVVCEEKKGLFGMRGSKLAKIKAFKKTPRKKS